MEREIKEGEYHIVWFDVMRRINGRDIRLNSFKTEAHARMFAAAKNLVLQDEGLSADEYAAMKR